MQLENETIDPRCPVTVAEVAGVASAGPPDLQRVRVLKVGPADAKRALVLLGGREEAANGFRGFARDLVERVPGLQVWAVDRREQNLADLSHHGADADGPDRYYLDRGYAAQDGSTAPFAAEWGLGVLLGDVRRVVLAAKESGVRDVFLGGHSVGAAAVTHYAAWDFDGTPGHADLCGLMQFDGGVRDAFKGAGMEFGLTVEAATGWLAKIRTGEVFENATSLAVRVGGGPRTRRSGIARRPGTPWTIPTGRPFSRIGFPPPTPPTVRSPTRASSASSSAPTSATPATGCGLADSTSAATGETRARRRSGVSPRPSRAPRPGPSSGTRSTGLMLDYVAANDFVDNEVTRHLGLRLWHVRDIPVPLYAFGSGLTNGTVATAAEELGASTAIPFVRTHTDLGLTHQDLLYAVPEQNACLRTAADFLSER